MDSIDKEIAEFNKKIENYTVDDLRELAKKADDLDMIACEICRDLIFRAKNDVICYNCGAIYCMKCCEKYWDEDDDIDEDSCKQCKDESHTNITIVNGSI